MTPGGKRDWRTVGCAALLGASIAFPAGLMIGGGGASGPNVPVARRSAPPSDESRTSRNLYSPRVGSDPYVIAQQRKVLRALEASCRQLKRHCSEAEQARLRIEEAEARR